MIPEIFPNSLVIILTQKLAYGFHRNRLTIRQLGLKTSASEWNIDLLRINIRYTTLNISDKVFYEHDTAPAIVCFTADEVVMPTSFI